LWTAGPVVILAVIASFVFYELPGIANVPSARAAERVNITVEGHQFYWLYRYPNGAVSIGTLHVPVGKVVDLTVKSGDVIHSWWIPQLGGKIQAIPGRTNHTWFKADSAGVYQGQCAELCGLYHAAMTARVVAEPQTAYQQFISSTASKTLGEQEFNGICATCHGMQGQGGYGPDLQSSTLLTQPSSLVQILHNGLDTTRPGEMPPVGDTWTKAQVQALVGYVSKHVYQGSASGG
ncbi:MAG: cytochrome c oxidase subunit II, partial [Gaiellaceae bacterium]